MYLCTIEFCGHYDTQCDYPRMGFQRQIKVFEIELLVDGGGSVTLDGQKYKLHENTLLLCKPNQYKQSVFPFKCLFIHLYFEEENEFYHLLKNAPDYYQLIDVMQYRVIFENFINHYYAHQQKDSYFLQSKLLELFYCLKRDAERNSRYIDIYKTNHNELINKALQFINSHYKEPLTLQVLSEYVGYSPNYFHHVFTHIIGKTPQEYLLETRIKNAKLMLIDNQLSIAEISYECGFSSQSYFTMQFRKQTYSTPHQYRKNYQQRYHNETII
ncbi:MAG: helix-turn-helix transcriptional regulator [Clostridia bacterium]|nr:helix-turn-helix transcriptional regulator [Clostridia bacterium]